MYVFVILGTWECVVGGVCWNVWDEDGGWEGEEGEFCWPSDVRTRGRGDRVISSLL